MKIEKIEVKDIDVFILRLLRALTRNMLRGPGFVPKESVVPNVVRLKPVQTKDDSEF